MTKVLMIVAQVPEMASDDGTLPPDSPFKAACDIFYEIATKMNTDLNSPRLWKNQLEAAGFVNVQDVVYKMPSGPWTRNKRLRVVGALEQQVCISLPCCFLFTHIGCRCYLTIWNPS